MLCIISFVLCRNVSVYLFAFFVVPCITYGILVPQPGIEPMPLQYELGALTTELPGNSLVFVFQRCIVDLQYFIGFGSKI